MFEKLPYPLVSAILVILNVLPYITKQRITKRGNALQIAQNQENLRENIR